MFVLWKVRPTGNFEDRRYQFRIPLGQYDLLPIRRSRRREQLLNGDVRLLLREGR
jgi:hypothetical protein